MCRYDGAATRLRFQGIDIMATALGAAFITVIAITVADHYLNSGRYTDAMLAVLRQVRHSFG